ncbi:hypothetical protein AWZ03_014416 [Drosophila navojoa]|uniref:Uncharacterized protein n=1 Tax=Drosophila navojoa TaxID=7232 RepID=A0A484ASW0_DRONA|nr:hypothetical protein AWZ03_014416 [Drosophila navojoa]
MATSKCVGNRMTERPSKVALGVVDTREYVEAYLEHELKSQRKIVNNDLALFYLNNAIDFTDKTMENSTASKTPGERDRYHFNTHLCESYAGELCQE